jgi:peroxin-1
MINLLREYGGYISILCTIDWSNVPQDIHSRILREKLFHRAFELDCPSRVTRVSALEDWGHDHLSPEQMGSLRSIIPQLAAEMDGFQISDILSVLEHALVRFLTHKTCTSAKFVDVLREKTHAYVPSHLRDRQIRKITHIKEADVGGLHHIKQELAEILQWPTRYPRLFRLCPLRWNSGVLIYGFPGCGKTLMVQAIAAESHLNCIVVKGPELLNKYIGSSEQAVRDVFLRARSARPSMIFFDEFDAIAPRRGHDNTGVTDRVVNQLLTELDGVESYQGVFIVAATSRPDLLDLALLRPGRFDKKFFCDFPDRQERLDILRVLCEKSNGIETADIDWLADQTSYYSGADLEALIADSQLEAIREFLASSTYYSSVNPMSISSFRGAPDEVDDYCFDDAEEQDVSFQTSIDLSWFAHQRESTFFC